MKKIFLIVVCFFSVIYSFAQKNSFGILNYTVPTGYELVKNDNVLTYYKENKSTGAYCNFFIYKLMPGHGGVQQDFDFAWTSLVQQPFKVPGNAAMQPAAAVKGWQLLVGQVTYPENGVNTVAMLFNFTGENNMQAVCIHSNSDAYKKDIEYFIASADVIKETAQSNSTQTQDEKVRQPVGDKAANKNIALQKNNVIGAGDMNVYSVTVPPTWNLNTNENKLLLEKNTSSGKRVIEFMKPVQSSGNLEKDMEHIFFEVFAGWELHPNPNNSVFEAGNHEKGQTCQGLNYYMLSNSIKKKDPNSFDVIKATVLLIQAGNKVAIINTTDNILGSEADMVLNFMLFNLKLNGVENKALNNKQLLIGTWGTNSGSYGNSLSAVTSYVAEGKYYVLMQSSYTMSHDYLNDIIKKKQFKNEGSFNINSNVLERKSSSGSTSKYFIRFYSSKYGNNAWGDVMGLYQYDYDKNKIESVVPFHKI